MKIEEMVQEVKEYGDYLRIVEFNNGFAVAYEKQEGHHEYLAEKNPKPRRPMIVKKVTTPGTFFAYSLLPQKTQNEVIGNYSANYTKDNNIVSFSKESNKTIREYLQNKAHKLDNLEEKIGELYKAAIEPLGVKQYNYRNWSEIGMAAAFAISWPILLPYFLLFEAKNDHSGDAGLAVLFAPFMLPYAIKEIINPTSKAMKISNRKIISKDNDNGNNVALIFGYGSQETPKRFNCLGIMFSDGTYCSEKLLFLDNKEKYDNSKYFLKLDEGLKKILNLKKEIDQEKEEYYKFSSKLRQTDQSELLKKIELA